MNIDNIEAFVHVIHFNSFNKAADALFLSQPSVTARIQSLERELDAKLFERMGKQFTLTEKGKLFLPYAQQILQSYKKGKQQIKYQKTMQELRIGCTVSVSNYILPIIVPSLKQHYPDLRFKLVTAPSETVVKLVQDKDIDIGLVRNITHPLLDSFLFYEDEIGLYANAEHPFATKTDVSMEDVRQEPLVFFECGSIDWMRLHRMFETLDRPPVIDYEVDNQETAKKLVQAGMGIGFLPKLCVREEVKSGLLVPVPVKSLGIQTLRTNLIALKGEQPGLTRLLLELSKKI
ncbi:LysR substrate-binding domain-containing protein [Paenibacillus sp. GCM10012307]|uniref:LysR family transcriptional regulator n=1 Tax=Paenibacillus roseus TaxID=2798579 RepID=A0A934J6D7_9BACL|nr:LysR family transcriptional regulator [Paenibacillus roseus]MBJ6363720.1 LysR family transcriptional regulator [Paenibacillus roseus]